MNFGKKTLAKEKKKARTQSNQLNLRRPTIPEENEKDILKSIKKTTEEIRAILVLANRDRLEETKKQLLKEGSMKSQIYDLCDGTKTTKDIGLAIQKDMRYVNSYLTTLRREGLVRSVEKDGTQVHEQIF